MAPNLKITLNASKLVACRIGSIVLNRSVGCDVIRICATMGRCFNAVVVLASVLCWSVDQ